MRTDGRALSPLIGCVLLVAIVVALSVTVGVMLVGFDDALGAPPPFVANEQSVRVSIAGNESEHTLEFVHRGGESVDANALTVSLAADDYAARIPVSEVDGSALDDGRWTADERLSMRLNESALCGNGAETASVELVYRGADRSYILSSRNIPIERGQFVIDGSRVRATTPYTANVKFVGTGWSSLTHDAPVNVTVDVAGTPAHGWYMQGDTASVVGSYGVSRQDSGTEIEVRAAGGQPEYECTFGYWGCERVGWNWIRVSSDQNTENVRVYRDGDSVPEFESESGQQSAAAYVEPYVEGGEITLDDNQAVYLFDFNEDGHDYQDAVVLVSFFAQRGEAGVYESHSRDVILCPARTRSASPNGGGGGNGNRA